MIQELQTHYGVIFMPDTDNAQYAWLIDMKRSPEDEHTKLVCDLLDESPKGVALDVGANFGCWTLPLAKHATQVLAFEPQEGVYQCLKASVTKNQFDNVHVFKQAVGAAIGTILVPNLDLSTESNFGGVSLGIPHHEQMEAPMILTPMTTIDEVAKDLDVSFIKIDVEGGEADVLEGTRETIARCKPIMFIEAMHTLTDTKALNQTIREMEYSICPQSINYLCLPKISPER